MHNTLSPTHHPVYFAAAVAVAIIVYGNVAWTYIYITKEKDAWLSRFLFYWNREGGVDDWARLCLGMIWPLSFAISIICWYIWLTFGGIVRTLVGKNLDGSPLNPVVPPPAP